MKQVIQFMLMAMLSTTMAACLKNGDGSNLGTPISSPVPMDPQHPSTSFLEAMSQAGCTFNEEADGVTITCNGTSGKIYNGVAGAVGAQGVQGPKGDRGDAGLTGSSGQAGANGVDGASCTISGSNLVCPDGTSISVGAGTVQKNFVLSGYPHLIKESEGYDGGSGICTSFYNTMNGSKVAYCSVNVGHQLGGIWNNGANLEVRMMRNPIIWTTWDCTGQAYASTGNNSMPLNYMIRRHLVFPDLNNPTAYYKVTGLAAVTSITGRSWKDVNGVCQMYGTPTARNAIEATSIVSLPTGTPSSVDYPLQLVFQ